MVQTRITVKIHPCSHRNEIVDYANEVLRVRISEPPDKGKANKELISFLSTCLEISKNRVDILRGHASRNKVIAVDGLSQEEILMRLFPQGHRP